MRSYIFVIALLAIITACKKEETNRITDGTYTTDGTAHYDPVTIYVKGAVITDTAIINEFLVRRQFPADFFHAPGAENNSTWMTSITIAGNTATVDSTKTISSITHRAGNVFILVQKDSVGMPSADGGTLGCSNIEYRIRQNPADHICIPFYLPGSTSPYVYNCTGQPRVPVENNGNSINIPILYFQFSALRESSFCSTRSLVTDYFDPNSVADMRTNDTLIIQSGHVTLTRQ